MIKSLTPTMNSGSMKRPASVKPKGNAIVSKTSHRTWCVVKVQSCIRRWLAMRLLRKLREEKLLKLKDEEYRNSLIVPLSPATVSSPEIITVSFKIQPQSSSSSSPTSSVIRDESDKEEIIKSSEEENIPVLKIESLDINTETQQKNKVNSSTITSDSLSTSFSSRSSSMSSSISSSSSLSSSCLTTSSANELNNPLFKKTQSTSQLTSSTNSMSSATSTLSSSSSASSISLRKRTIDELYKVEKSYVSDMGTLIDVFYHPFKKEESFPKEYLYTLFCNIEEIRSVHISFLESLEKRLAQWDESTTIIGDIFLPYMGSFQKLYELYINNYEKAFAFTKYLKSNPASAEVQKSLTAKERDSRCRSLDFGSLIVMPIQRLPRYTILLKEIEKNTPAGHPDLQQTSLALVQLHDLTLFLNESKRTASHEDKLEEIKQSIDGLDHSQITSSQRYIMEGQLNLLKGVVSSSKKDLYVYLFKEFILCTENINSSKTKTSSLKFSKSDNSGSNSPTISHNNSNSSLSHSTPNGGSRTSSLQSLNGASSTNSSPSSSGLSSPTYHGSGHNVYSTMRSRSLFKKIQFSDVKAVSVLKNFKDSIQVVTSKKVYTFVASSTELRDKWFNAIDNILHSLTPPPSPTLPRSAHRNSLNLTNSINNSNTSNPSNPQSALSPVAKRKNRFSIQLT